MKRSFVCDPKSPYHVTSRCINKDWFSLPLNQVWPIFTGHLWFVRQVYGLKVHAFILMANHFHLLVTAPEANLSEAMAHLIRESSRDITHEAGRINQTFARRFKRTRLDSYFYFMNSYKYIYQNPIRAGLVDRVEVYPYSTLPGMIGLGPIEVPTDDLLLRDNLEWTLRWLNTPIERENCAVIQNALRRKKFIAARTPTKAHSPVETSLV